jgi:hypothetical protein
MAGTLALTWNSLSCSSTLNPRGSFTWYFRCWGGAGMVPLLPAFPPAVLAPVPCHGDTVWVSVGLCSPCHDRVQRAGQHPQPLYGGSRPRRLFEVSAGGGCIGPRIWTRSWKPTATVPPGPAGMCCLPQRWGCTCFSKCPFLTTEKRGHILCVRRLS